MASSDKPSSDMSGSEKSNADPEAPKIEFPCDYPIKVMGKAGNELHTFVLEVMESHSPGFDQTRITIRDSRNGNFQAITVTIIATGEPQLQAIFADLKVSPLVQIVL
jgi:putative lipoic acid-binding regulatory protein